MLCAPGFACSPGSQQADARPCGSPQFYCPEGTGEPWVVEPGMYTSGGLPDGTTRTSASVCPSPDTNGGMAVYCPGTGLMLPCPAGLYGVAGGLNSSACSGNCAAGWRCPAGSTTPTALPCGGADVYVFKEGLYFRGRLTLTRECVCGGVGG
jgi:hypothetical protein